MYRLFLCLFITITTFAQNYDHAVWEIDTIKYTPIVVQKTTKSFKAIINSLSFPNNINQFHIIYHQPPICQGYTGTCWAFASTSFIESEIYRTTGKKIKLSEMFIVYYEYLERAIDFIKTHGETYINEGSEASAILRILQKYGAVPAEIYEGKNHSGKFHNHKNLIKEIQTFLNQVKTNAIWNEAYIIQTVKNILNKEMGEPPNSFVYENQYYTPKTFVTNYLKIQPSAYFRFMSTITVPYYEKSELIENDNWWHDNQYFNVPPDTFVKLINQALINNYTVCLCGDVSEPAYDHNELKIATIPKFDLPYTNINEYSRELRLTNESTTDDHCVHIIGYTRYNGHYFYLIKDSNGHTFDGKYPGYRIYDEWYIKLKMMNILLHGDGARWLLERYVK